MADIDIRDRHSGMLLGSLGYGCRAACGQARVAVSLVLTLDASQKPPVRGLGVVLADTEPRAAPAAVSLRALGVVHEQGDGVLRQVAYANLEEIRFFLDDPGFRRAEGVQPGQPCELSVSDLSILDHVRQFGALPGGEGPQGESRALISVGLLAAAGAGGSRLRLTDKGGEWLVSATRQLRERFRHGAVPRSGLAATRAATRQ